MPSKVSELQSADPCIQFERMNMTLTWLFEGTSPRVLGEQLVQRDFYVARNMPVC